MADEIVQDVVETPVAKSEEPKYTETEQQALDQGWRPKEEWTGPEDEWVPAKAFIKYGEIQSSLKAVKQEASQKEKVIRAMKEFHLRVKEDAKKEVFDTLKRQKREAIKQEDYMKVAELDLQLDEIQTGLDTKFKQTDVELQKVESSNTAPSQEFVEWNSRNTWYNPNDGTGMSAEADDIGLGYARRNPGKAPAEILEHVEKRIRQLYPEKFRNIARDAPAAVDDGGERVEGSAPRKSRVALTDAEKQAADNFGMTHEEYAKEMKAWEKRKGVA